MHAYVSELSCVTEWFKSLWFYVLHVIYQYNMYTTYPSKMTQEFGQGKKWTSYQSDLSHSLLHFLP